MNVYIITSGDYSDYHIDAVCETFEAAQRKCMLLSSRNGYDSYRVEVWNTETGHKFQNDGKYYHVWLQDGELKCEESDTTEYEITATSKYRIPTFLRGKCEFQIDGLYAIDEAHAIKIASDVLTEYKAMLANI